MHWDLHFWHLEANICTKRIQLTSEILPRVAFLSRLFCVVGQTSRPLLGSGPAHEDPRRDDARVADGRDVQLQHRANGSAAVLPLDLVEEGLAPFGDEPATTTATVVGIWQRLEAGFVAVLGKRDDSHEATPGSGHAGHAAGKVS